jgi:hypothetical protein
MLSWSRQLSRQFCSKSTHLSEKTELENSLAIDFKPGNLNDLHTFIPLLLVERPIIKWRKPLPWNSFHPTAPGTVPAFRVSNPVSQPAQAVGRFE